MVKMMDIPDLRGRGSFWEAYRACVEKNSLFGSDQANLLIFNQMSPNRMYFLVLNLHFQG